MLEGNNMTKAIEEELNLINFFENKKNELIANDSYNYVLYNENKKMFIQTNKPANTNPSSFRFENLDKEEFEISSYKINILSSQIISTDGPNKAVYSVDKFHSNSFHKDRELKYKLIIPCNKKNKIHYNDYFSLMDFMISINGTLFSGIKFKINNFNFQMYHQDDNFVVETTDIIFFEDFDKYCRLALASFGFITGSVCMDKGYYFGYKDEKITQFLFDSSFYNTYKTQYNLITTNAYEYYQNIDLNHTFDENEFQSDERIEDLNKQLKPIEKNVFETLINKMINNTKFSEVVFSIISINNLKGFSSFLQAGLYTIVLEMITSLIENTKSPIQESILKDNYKETRKELADKLHKVAKDFFEENEIEYEGSIVEKRLNGVYNPINTDKLTEAYEILEIPLNEKDKKNIRLRNKFLHGSIPFKDKDLILLSKKLFHINLELNYLVNALVLKDIGYDGVLKNLGKIYLDYSNLNALEEQEYYKTLSAEDNKTS